MNPIAYTPNIGDKFLFECSSCNRIYVDKEMASKCCICQVCGKISKNGLSDCVDCQHDKNNNRIKFLLDSAKEQDYDGMLTDGKGDYWTSMDDYLEDLEDNPEYVREEWLFCCKPIVFHLDVHRMVENADNELSGGIDDNDLPDINGLEELEKAVNEFNDKNKHRIMYETDWKKKVKVPNE
jgi:hypothetical protein